MSTIIIQSKVLSYGGYLGKTGTVNNSVQIVIIISSVKKM